MSADLTPAVVGAIAAITAAFIGLIVAVTSAVIAKEQKVSEFRQAWIDALRNDIAEFTALILFAISEKYRFKLPNETRMSQIVFPNSTKESKQYEKFKVQQRRSIDELTKASIIIKMKLNKEEHKKLLESIDNVMKFTREDGFFDGNEYKLVDTMLDNFHQALKKEWEVVKKGEKHFVRFRDFGELCLFTFITAFFVLLAAVKFPQYFPGIN
tara:strand:+ start:428 stop:1063 length:636 start_codon:yes stop_codon:yes gene_type:complete